MGPVCCSRSFWSYQTGTRVFCVDHVTRPSQLSGTMQVAVTTGNGTDHSFCHDHILHEKWVKGRNGGLREGARSRVSLRHQIAALLQGVGDGNGRMEDRAGSRPSASPLTARRGLAPTRFRVLELYSVATGARPRTAARGGQLRLLAFVIQPQADLGKLFKFRAQRVQEALIQVIGNEAAATQGAHGGAGGPQAFVVIDQQAVIRFLAIVFLCAGDCFLKVEKRRHMNLKRDSTEEYNTTLHSRSDHECVTGNPWT